MTNLFGKSSEWFWNELPVHKRKKNMIRIYYGSILDNDDNRNIVVPVDIVESIKPSFSGNYRMVLTYKVRRLDLPTTAKYIEFNIDGKEKEELDSRRGASSQVREA